MFATPAFAQAAAQSSTQSGLEGFFGIAPLILIFVVFYFLMIRPQQKRVRQMQAMVAATKKGDQAVTAGGILGKVIKVDDAHVELEIAPNVRVKVVKATLAEVIPAGGAKPAND